ncbi:hypothetical protein RhiJN_09458 [Ceratobasidium sp. AG-Ba]|nr:hypothetical protein RhiJN_09458 [Ceratobasidium sp. AG-Ba]QRW10252.1 hypothetical protein RhiLY_09251 [Ceratobasidium sp. AG-Ba]
MIPWRIPRHNYYHVLADAEWGIPIDYHLKFRQRRELRKSSVDEVLRSIKILVAGRYDAVSEEVLESMLSLVHYPQHLGLLIDIKITSGWWDLMSQHVKKFPIMSRSFGFLMLQFYGLFLNIAVLDYHEALDDFIRSYSDKPLDQAQGVLSPLMQRSTQLVISKGVDHQSLVDNLGLTNSSRAKDPAFLTNMCDHRFGYSMRLLSYTFTSRRDFLHAYNRQPNMGWPLILGMVCLYLKVCSTSDAPEENGLEFSKRLRDLLYRCYIVSNPSQHQLIAGLINITNDLAGASRILNRPFMRAVDSEDGQNIGWAMSDRYEDGSHYGNVESAELKDLCSMFVYANMTMESVDGYTHYHFIFESAFKRLWRELDHFLPSNNHRTSFDCLYEYIEIHFQGLEYVKALWLEHILTADSD